MRHPIFARVYEKLSVQMDHAGAADHRRTLVEETVPTVHVAGQWLVNPRAAYVQHLAPARD